MWKVLINNGENLENLGLEGFYSFDRFETRFPRITLEIRYWGASIEEWMHLESYVEAFKSTENLDGFYSSDILELRFPSIILEFRYRGASNFIKERMHLENYMDGLKNTENP